MDKFEIWIIIDAKEALSRRINEVQLISELLFGNWHLAKFAGQLWPDPYP